MSYVDVRRVAGRIAAGDEVVVQLNSQGRLVKFSLDSDKVLTVFDVNSAFNYRNASEVHTPTKELLVEAVGKILSGGS